MSAWVLEKWFDLLSAVGIIGRLFFTAVSLRSETKTRRIANLLTITANYREIWKQFLIRPDFARVLDANADLIKQPVTRAEEIFVNQVVQQIGSVYYAMNDELVIKVEGLRRDISQFFTAPIPAAVWERTKRLQNDRLVAFIESCRNWK